MSNFYTMDENSIILALYGGDPWVGRLKLAHQFYYIVYWNGSEFGDKHFIGDIEQTCAAKNWIVVNSEKELLAELMKLK